MVFAAYQKEQRERIKELMDHSHMAAKMHTYATPLHKFLANWNFPLCDDRTLTTTLEHILRQPRNWTFFPV
ncbi:hypothetical protein GB937_009380 [Aspergillus fischeri]|nr:hypothetical protein GB937_009380 [Aspergillus fischeri]